MIFMAAIFCGHQSPHVYERTMVASALSQQLQSHKYRINNYRIEMMFEQSAN